MLKLNGATLWSAAIALAALSMLLSPYFSGLALTALVFCLLGLSLNLVYGYLGYLSFGHAAFFGLGAYVAGLLYVKTGMPFLLCGAIALLLPTLLGALVGFASLRVSGAYFAIATLASAEILRLVSISWVSMTRGPLGIVVPAPEVDLFASWGLGFHQYHLAVSVLIVALVLAGLARLMATPTGRSWLAIRESINLAESVGIPTLRLRVINIAISGGIAGLAGVLLVPKVLVLSPDLFSTNYSAMGLLIVILGGRGSIAGVVLGAIIFAILPETLRTIDEYRLIIFAALLLVAVRTQAGGVIGLLGRFLPKPPAPPEFPLVAETLVTPKAQPPAGDPVIVVSELVKKYGGVIAVNGSNFEVREHEIFGIIGPNGAGKTTLLKMLGGFVAPTSGRIAMFSKDIEGSQPHQIAEFGIVCTFQHTELYKKLSVIDNVMTGTWLVGTTSLRDGLLHTKKFAAADAERRLVAAEALKLVGMAHRANAMADELSYGEQKLLSIAVALAAKPRILLLDEPAAGLNHSEADRLSATLRSLQARGLTLVIVDHNLQLMMATCDRMLVVNHGVPLATGTPAEIAGNAAVREAYLG